MKHPTFFRRLTTLVVVIAVAPTSMAQTCVPGVQATNPTSVYTIDTANGTVTDTRTGLMWDRCARGLSGSSCTTGTAATFTWQAALDATALIGSYKGYSDWRLPNIKELNSLIEVCRSNPAINEFAFPSTPTSEFFWSSSPVLSAPAFAWDVDFDGGYTLGANRNTSERIRLVRGRL